MKTFLPCAVKLEAREGEDGRFEIFYAEQFSKESYGGVPRQELLDNTLKAAKTLFNKLGCEVDLRGDWFEVRGTIARETLGNMMAMEFFGWSDIGQRSLIDILISSAVGAAAAMEGAS